MRFITTDPTSINFKVRQNMHLVQSESCMCFIRSEVKSDVLNRRLYIFQSRNSISLGSLQMYYVYVKHC